MENFSDYNVWTFFNLIAVLMASLLVGNVLKKSVPLLQASLIPTSVLGGGILVIVAGIYKAITGDIMFDTAFFGGNGTDVLEMITYHMLAFGFIASALKTSDNKMTKERTVEIFNTGVATVSTYLIQAIVGLAVSFIAAAVVKDFFSSAGILLALGYGQGTGQALNYGGIYENDFGFVGGKSFGLTIAALGFLSASIGGVIHLNILRKQGKIKLDKGSGEFIDPKEIQNEDEIPMQESIDKLTIQIALIILAYAIAYGLMSLLGMILPGMKSVIFGFNFLLGVIAAMLIKMVMKALKKAGAIQKNYTNNFLLTRVSNFFFDIMVVAGIAAIRLSALEDFWGIILIMGVLGAVVTYIYQGFICKTLFKDYAQEQFLAMYGMLTGTASTGVILLREIDGDFKTPAADNMVYQNMPAIVFGFPIMLIAAMAPKQPGLTYVIVVALFVVMNLILFRSKIFRKKQK